MPIVTAGIGALIYAHDSALLAIEVDRRLGTLLVVLRLARSGAAGEVFT